MYPLLLNYCLSPSLSLIYTSSLIYYLSLSLIYTLPLIYYLSLILIVSLTHTHPISSTLSLSLSHSISLTHFLLLSLFLSRSTLLSKSSVEAISVYVQNSKRKDRKFSGKSSSLDASNVDFFYPESARSPFWSKELFLGNVIGWDSFNVAKEVNALKAYFTQSNV